MEFKKVVPLNSEKIKRYLQEIHSHSLPPQVLNQSLDLSREFRSKDYPLIHLLLQNPLQELISMAAPRPADSEEKQHLFLYDDGVPIAARRNDQIQWIAAKKMSIKLIIHNKKTELYKLKNNRNDEGVVVMRRQTWRAEGLDEGWRRNEYKLVSRETYFKQSQDGRLTVTEGQSVQDFPVLVHYFFKNNGDKRGLKRKRAVTQEGETEEGEAGGEDWQPRRARSLSQKEEEEEDDDEEDEEEEESNGCSSTSFSSSSSSASTSITPLPQILPLSSTPSSSSSPPSLHNEEGTPLMSMKPSNSVHHMIELYEGQSSSALVNPRPAKRRAPSSSSSVIQQSSSPSTDASPLLSSAVIGPHSPLYASSLFFGGDAAASERTMSTLFGPVKIEIEDDDDHSHADDIVKNTDSGASSASTAEQTSSATVIPNTSSSISSSNAIFRFTSRIENGAILPFTPVPSPSHNLLRSSSSQQQSFQAASTSLASAVSASPVLGNVNSAHPLSSSTSTSTSTSVSPLALQARPSDSEEGGLVEIKSYAPDSGPCTENTKVLLHFDKRGFIFRKGKSYRFSCLFGEAVAEAKEIANGLLEFSAPPHKPGIVYFWVACVEEGREHDVEPKDLVQYSQPVPFYYTPVVGEGRLSLAWELSGLSDLSMLSKFKYTAKELDLSHNDLETVSFLEGFRELHTLILDNNHLTHNVKLPLLPKLHTLSLNHNWILEIEKLMDNLVDSVPSLRYLSTLHNGASPFFSTAKHHYYNYRFLSSLFLSIHFPFFFFCFQKTHFSASLSLSLSHRIYILSRLRNLTHLDCSPVTMEEWRHAACIIPSDTAETELDDLSKFTASFVASPFQEEDLDDFLASNKDEKDPHLPQHHSL
ncbi:Leucine-rich repeat-containing protein C10orf11 [Balamuthia mandrillaris]